MSVKSKEIRTGKQTSKQTNEAVTTARKKKKKEKYIAVSNYRLCSSRFCWPN